MSGSSSISNTVTKTGSSSSSQSASITPSASVSSIASSSSSKSSSISISESLSTSTSNSKSHSQSVSSTSSITISRSSSSSRSTSGSTTPDSTKSPSITPSITESSNNSVTQSKTLAVSASGTPSSSNRFSTSSKETSTTSVIPSTTASPSFEPFVNIVAPLPVTIPPVSETIETIPSPSQSITPSRSPIFNGVVFNNNEQFVGTVSLIQIGSQSVTLVLGVGPEQPDTNLLSGVINAIALDEDGNEVEFDGEAELCLAVSSINSLTDESCLGFLDESVKPPEWVCEDPCITVNQDKEEVCGKTTHFTSFAILLSGGSGGSTRCNSSWNNYIFDEAWKDLILLVSVSILICCMVWLFALWVLCTRIGSEIVLGNSNKCVFSERDEMVIIKILNQAQEGSTFT